MILSSTMYEKTYLRGFFKGVLEALYDELWMVGSPLQGSSPREKGKKWENS